MGLGLKITYKKEEINLTDFTIENHVRKVEDIPGRNEFLARNVNSLELNGKYSIYDVSKESLEVNKLACWYKVTAHEESCYRKLEFILKDNNDDEYDSLTFEKAFMVDYSEVFNFERSTIDFYALIREFNEEILNADGRSVGIATIGKKSEVYKENEVDASVMLFEEKEEKEYIAPKTINPFDSPNDVFSSFGFILDPKDKLFYTKKDAWQRNLGYCDDYNNNAHLIFAYITWEKFKFNYAGKEWLIEIWKGTYGGNIGAEIGIYKRNPGDKNLILNDFYKSAPPEDELKMSFTLKTLSGRKIFSRNTSIFENGVHWWLTAFKPNEDKSLHKFNVVLDASITLKNVDMANAFLNSINAVKSADPYLFNYAYIASNTVYFSWKRNKEDRWNIIPETLRS